MAEKELPSTAEELNKFIRNKLYGNCQKEGCNTRFEKSREWQKFCSVKCRNDYHNEINFPKKGKIIAKLFIRKKAECKRCGDDYLVVYDKVLHCPKCITELLALFDPSVASTDPHKEMADKIWKETIPESK